MKKILIMVIASALFLVGCENVTDDISNESAAFDPKETVLAEPSQGQNPYPYLNGDEIVLIKMYSNWAEGYQYRANYVTANGNEYSYEYNGDYGSDSYSVDDVFNFPLDDVAQTFTEEQMTEILYDLSQVGTVKFEEALFADDYGSYTVYGVVYNEIGDKKVIELGTFGDSHLIPDDINAKKVCNFMGVNWEN